MIPSASKQAGDLLNAGAAYGFCGGELATIDNNVIAATVCCKQDLSVFIVIEIYFIVIDLQQKRCLLTSGF